MSAPAPEPSPAGLLDDNVDDDDDTLPPLKPLDENELHTIEDSTKELAGRIFKAEGMTRSAFLKSDMAAKNRLMYRATTILHCLPEYMGWLFESIPFDGEKPFIEHDTMGFRAIYNCLAENEDVLGRIIQQKEKAEENVTEKAEETGDEEDQRQWDGPTGDNAYSLMCKLLADNPEVAEVFISEVEGRAGVGKEHAMVLNSLNEWDVYKKEIATVFKSRADSSGHLYHYKS